MANGDIFSDVIQADLARIPLFEALHTERFNGCDYLLSQVVVKNIFTDFDRLLSRHLAATRGEGFPQFTAFVRFREAAGMPTWKSFDPTHHASVPHALRHIAERAVSFGRDEGLMLRHAGRTGSAEDEGIEVPLEREDVNTLKDALDAFETIGEPEFMEISGDFDVVFCRPSPEQRPITMYLRKGSASVPSDRSATGTPFECPIAGFRRGIRDDMGAQGYVAAARHALSAAKEAAVSEFRSAAETQIMAFDRALHGRPLDGHRSDSALSLIARLRAGLGDELRGLGEAARITAMEWSLAVDTLGRNGAVHIAAGHDASEGHRRAAG
ncbi:MAG TPA: hypothetical protein VMM55_03005 [Thermohalobaculum sp.]|nr:hypothetical protein [Thermohalobaculum sp.]